MRAIALVAPAGLIATGDVRPSWRRPLLHRVGRETTRVVAPLVPRSGRASRRALSRLVADPDALDEQTIRELVRGSRAGRSTGAAGIEIVHAGLLDRIDRVRVPVLVVFGEEDRVIDPAGGRGSPRRCPTARLVFLPGTGHLPQIERPDEVAARSRVRTRPRRSVSVPYLHRCIA